MDIVVDIDLILNIFLDFDQEYKEAEKVWNFFYSGKANGYISKEGLERVHSFIEDFGDEEIAEEICWLIKTVFKTIPINNEILQEASLLKCKDLESKIEVACAKKNNFEAILTRTPKNFKDINYNIWSFEDLLYRQSLEKKYNELDYPDSKKYLDTFALQIQPQINSNNIQQKDIRFQAIKSVKNYCESQEPKEQSDNENKELNFLKMQSNRNDRKSHVSFFSKFLLFCAGTNTNLIYKPECERDRSKYTAIGATILITAVMAGLSGGYALFTVFQSLPASAGFGSFWGVTIFNLDRSFTSTTKKTKHNKNWFKTTVATVTRLSLATLVGLVIAKPFEVKVFETKINETIARETLLTDKKTRNSTAEAEAIKELKNELKKLRNEQEETQEKWLKWETLANQEAEGAAGTGLRGKGIVYDEKKATANELRQQLQELKSVITNKETEITKLENQQNNTIAQIRQQTRISFIDQLAILHKLSKEDEMIFLASWGISLLLVAVEISPLLVKLLAPYGTYDSLVEAEDENLLDIQEQKIKAVRDSIITENTIRNNIRERTAVFIDKQYLQVLQKALTHENLEQVREEIILSVAEIVEKQLSQRIQDASSLGLEINSSINEIIKEETKNQYQEKISQDSLEEQINKMFNMVDNLKEEIRNSNSTNGKHSK